MTIIVALLCPMGAAQSVVTSQLSSLHTPVELAAQSGNMVALLTFIADKFNVSVAAELARPFQAVMSIPGGQHSLEEILDDVLRQAPGYEWADKEGTLWIYQRNLVKAKRNFLNLPLRVFNMPSNLGELKRFLPVSIRRTSAIRRANVIW